MIYKKLKLKFILYSLLFHGVVKFEFEVGCNIVRESLKYRGICHSL